MQYFQYVVFTSFFLLAACVPPYGSGTGAAQQERPGALSAVDETAAPAPGQPGEEQPAPADKSDAESGEPEESRPEEARMERYKIIEGDTVRYFEVASWDELEAQLTYLTRLDSEADSNCGYFYTYEKPLPGEGLFDLDKNQKVLDDVIVQPQLKEEVKAALEERAVRGENLVNLCSTGGRLFLGVFDEVRKVTIYQWNEFAANFMKLSTVDGVMDYVYSYNPKGPEGKGLLRTGYADAGWIWWSYYLVEEGAQPQLVEKCTLGWVDEDEIEIGVGVMELSCELTYEPQE